MHISDKNFRVQIRASNDKDTSTSRRILLLSDTLKSAKIATGDVMLLLNASSQSETFAVGVAWPSIGLPNDCIEIDISLSLTAGLDHNQHAIIYPLTGQVITKLPRRLPPFSRLKPANLVCLKEVGHHKRAGANREDLLPLLLRETLGVFQFTYCLYCLLITTNLVELKYITSSQVLEVSFEGAQRRFCVSSIKPKNTIDDLSHDMNNLVIDATSQPTLWSIDWDTSVTILSPKPEIESLSNQSPSDAYSTVGGLQKQIEQIRDLIELPLTRPDLFHHLGLKPPRGILLHGPPGTGKTHLARAIATSTKSSVIVINGPELSSAYHGETESKLRAVFRQARKRSPCIVVLDEVDALVPRRDEGSGGGGEVERRVVATLLTILDEMETMNGDGKGRVVVIGTTNRPNAIDPALRRPGRFDREIEIGVPDAEARLDILNVLLAKTPHDVSQDDLRALAARAHGYVGADLTAVVREAGTIAIKRWLASQSNAPQATSNPSNLALTLPDLLSSLPTIRASALRSLFTELPPIHYSSIGGQAHTIQKLREAVEWPLLHPDAFKRLGVKPPRGVMLYGPPGCSKTVLARACACESGLGMLAVKGPELLNKFVGESERAVREIFRKARAASPCIIFFDEIDALATSRTSDNESGGSSSSHEGVLTSLLNEMDGVQELQGVVVIAATNRPEAIDSALMRPGRFDRALYVGPPDQAGREEILKIRMKEMSVDPAIDVQEIARLTEGCSGAEITALCREAAMITMHKNMNAPFVPQEAFEAAARGTRRQITPAVMQKFERWRDNLGTL
ncbi:hypothetical protein AMATHDRAFT_143374 [Amanita thiersii Skay4041]|uniref:AAA+ ATPase domain-containing protein n=1 Tax=Amanita thiersii Skay4041 TaxID=703135 RepID=A0A2A9NJC0_9AGAR|nr:hypothetical protein AMATHDRAFT_143374 [Amanita thiersii Skay4041]